jgi:hypothetical protein
MLGGVGRVPGNGHPYPILAIFRARARAGARARARARSIKRSYHFILVNALLGQEFGKWIG